MSFTFFSCLWSLLFHELVISHFMLPKRFYTASTIVVCNGTALLHMHPKFCTWLPVGGHVESNELPHEVAIREVNEETGLTVELLELSPRMHFGYAETLVSPAHTQLITLTHDHQLVDFLYYASISADVANLSSTHQFRWFTREELSTSLSLKLDVRYFAIEAIELLSH